MEAAVLQGEEIRGTITAETKGLYTVFLARVDTEEVCRLYGIFEGGEAALGVPVPEQGKMTLRISVPTGRLPGGKLLRGELRTGETSPWRTFPGGKRGDAELPPGKVRGRTYRFPWHPGDKLPCEAYFCFFRYVREGSGEYLELTLDEDGYPAV